MNPGFRIFPNPVTEDLNLEIPDLKGNALVTIYSTTGQHIREYEIFDPVSVISTTGIPGGIYILQVRTGEKTFYGKIQVLE